MNRETWKVFFAAALGAGVGSLIALEVSAMLWWVGLIVGGITGYLSYEWRAVLAAIPAAYRAASGYSFRFPSLRYWQYFGLGFLVWLSFVSWLFVSFLFLCFLCLYISPLMYNFIAMFSAGSTMAVFLVGIIMLWEGLGKLKKPDWRLQDYIQNQKELLYYGALPMVLFYHLPRHLPRGVWYVMKRTPKATVRFLEAFVFGVIDFVLFLRRFFWKLFLMIHSERRLICGVDAGVGAAIGYFSGSALVGAFAGGVFGAINYAVVTERWLKPKGFLPVQNE